MSSSGPEIGKIRREMEGLGKQIEEMHLKVHRYLSDRSKYPHPHHEVLISRIMNYQVNGVRSREIELRLENVQHKALNRARVWKQWFEDDAKGLFRKGSVESAHEKTELRSDPLIDKVYERAEQLWTKLGVTNTELKEDFVERVLPEIDEARRNLKKGKKIIFTYDKDIHRIQLKVTDKE